MARQTRAQRRARREAQGPAPQRTRTPLRTPAPAPTPAPPQRPRGGFVSESWAELKKVEWPGQSQVIQATIVVLIACIVVGIYLYANDALWKPVVQKLVGQ